MAVSIPEQVAAAPALQLLTEPVAMQLVSDLMAELGAAELLVLPDELAVVVAEPLWVTLDLELLRDWCPLGGRED